jgi:hypothetical protein
MRTNVSRTIATAIVALAITPAAASARSLTLKQGTTAIGHWAHAMAAELNKGMAEEERAEQEASGELSLELGNHSARLNAVRLSSCVRSKGAVGCVVALVALPSGIECVTIAIALPGSPIKVTKSGRFQCAQGEG